MKTFKLSIVALATLVFGTVIFISCSNEESTVTTDNSLMNYRVTDATAFLSEFYNDSWTTGESATVSDSLNTYNVTEIIVDTDTRARGYLVKDNNSGELLYFADVDRNNHVFRTVNLITEEEKAFLDIDRHPDYSHSDEFDIIKIIDDLGGVTQPSGWFWGEYCTLDKDENGFPKYHLVEATSGSPAIEYCSWTCVKRRFGFSFGEPYTKPGGCDDDSYPVASP